MWQKVDADGDCFTVPEAKGGQKTSGGCWVPVKGFLIGGSWFQLRLQDGAYCSMRVHPLPFQKTRRVISRVSKWMWKKYTNSKILMLNQTVTFLVYGSTVLSERG